MPRYLVTCQCGEKLPVDVGQAGSKVTCRCGAQVDVPTLRAMRHLPMEKGSTDADRPAWGTRSGVIVASVVIALLLGLLALSIRLAEPELPEFDPAARDRNVETGIEAMTPAEGWEMWVERYLPLAEQGFTEFKNPEEPAYRAYIARLRVIQTGLGAAAAIFAVTAIVAALWPRGTPRRR